MKPKPLIERLPIWQSLTDKTESHWYIYSACVNYTVLFLKDAVSIKHIFDTFFRTSQDWNQTKKIWSWGYWSPELVVQIAVTGMRCIDLNNDTLKILGTHFFYKNIERRKNFCNF